MCLRKPELNVQNQERLQEERRMYPRAYEVGYVKFLESCFHVDERVYIPTPETEILVEMAASLIQQEGFRGPVVDMGTGSGVIGISLALRFPSLSLVGVDISAEALAVAQENCNSLKCRSVKLVESDLCSRLELAKPPGLVVANLPWGSPEYLLRSHSMEELEFMPEVAIFPSQGLIGTYRDLIEEIGALGWKTTLICEAGVLPFSVVSSELEGWTGWSWVEDDGYGVIRVDF